MRSKKLLVSIEREGWKELRSKRNLVRASYVPFHIIKMSLMYRLKTRGVVVCVSRSLYERRHVDIGNGW